MKNISLLARQLKGRIGAHYRLIGDRRATHDDYMRARALSDDAESTARYLAQYLPAAQAAIIRQFTGVER